MLTRVKGAKIKWGENKTGWYFPCIQYINDKSQVKNQMHTRYWLWLLSINVCRLIKWAWFLMTISKMYLYPLKESSISKYRNTPKFKKKFTVASKQKFMILLLKLFWQISEFDKCSIWWTQQQNPQNYWLTNKTKI